MADPLTIAAIGGTILSGAGAISSANAAESRAEQQAQIMEAEAKQRERMAGQERASMSREIVEKQRNKERVMSRAQTVNAASGTGSLDQSFIEIVSDLEREGEYRKDVARYEGESRARDLEFGADINKYEASSQRAQGKAAKRAGYLKAAGSVLEGGASMYKKYGGKPSGTTTYNSQTGSAGASKSYFPKSGTTVTWR